MKKITALLLLAALLTTATACSDSGADEPATTTTGVTTEAGIPGDTLLTSEGYDIDFTQYLDIPELSSIKASLAELDEIWETYANAIRYDNVVLTEAGEDDIAALTDSVNIHYKGYSASDDVVLSESTMAGMTNFDYDEEGNLLEGYDLVLGSGNFIGAYESEEHPEKNNLGFEEQLIGATVGETRTITVTFRDNYGSEELNGTVVKFDVTINSLQKGTLPELTDEMISEYTGGQYTTISGLQEYINTFYKENLAYTAVLDAITVKDYPEEAMNNSIDDYIASYIASNYSETLTDEESKAVYDEQYDNAYASAKDTVSERMKIEYLIKHFDITMTQDEYLTARAEDFDANIYYYVMNYGIYDEQTLEDAFGKEYLVTQYKFYKLIPLLTEIVVFE